MPAPLLAADPPPALATAGIGLRRQRADDIPFARALYEMQRAAELAPVAWDDAAKAAFLDQQFAAQQAHYAANRPTADFLIVTARDGAAIGRLYVDRTTDPWRLAELALLPGASRRGIGTVLVRWLLAAAADAGASGVDLHVAIDNEAAAAFYRRLGFAEVPSSVGSHARLHRAVDAQVKTAS